MLTDKSFNKVYIDYKVYSVLKLKDKYGFKVKLTFNDNTENIRQIGGFKKKSDANNERDNIIFQLKNRTYVVDSKIKFKEFSEYWLEDVMKLKLKYNSYMSYRNILNNYASPFFDNLYINQINISHIQKFYNYVTEKHKSVARSSKAVLKSLFDYAKEKNVIEINPTLNVNLPKCIEEINPKILNIDIKKTLSIEQTKLLIEKSKGTPIYLHILFALLTGLRKQEINGLKYKDIDFVNRKIYLTRQLGVDPNKSKEDCKKKTYTKQEIKLKSYSSERIIDIPDMLFEAILEERQKYNKNRNRRINDKNNPFLDLGYICCSTYGHPRSKGFHNKYYNQLKEENDLPDITFHDLRHTYTTLLLMNNFDLKAVSQLLGHASTIITANVYFDKNKIVIDCENELNTYIDKVKPNDEKKEEINDVTDTNLEIEGYFN